jgi:hypothetical protein
MLLSLLPALPELEYLRILTSQMLTDFIVGFAIGMALDWYNKPKPSKR